MGPFAQASYKALCAARVTHLWGLNLLVPGNRILDLGCATGGIAEYLLKSSCDVVGVDGRPENVAECEFPAYVADVRTADLTQWGKFDAVIAYGLLYHLHDPRAAIANIGRVGAPLLALGSIICDYDKPILLEHKEGKHREEALDGLGCRPSPSYLIAALHEAGGYKYALAPTKQPAHFDFAWESLNDKAHTRNGHNLRRVIIASQYPLQLK